MTDDEVNDPQAERREVKNTYLSHTHADEAGGRFMRLVPTTVTGAGAVPEYPAASPHHADPTGPEQPLGIDVNETVPVGEAFELQRSLGDDIGRPPSCIAALGDEATTETELGAPRPPRASPPSTNKRED